MVASLLDWLGRHQQIAWWSAGISLAVFFCTLAAIPFVVARMPANYFVERNPPPDSWRSRHRAVRVTFRVLKDLLGLILILAGLVLAVPLVPGQGILTILIGISLLDFPGKRNLELKLIRIRTVRRTINWIRARAQRPPLQLPPREGR
jgi:hypothetical protein